MNQYPDGDKNNLAGYPGIPEIPSAGPRFHHEDEVVLQLVFVEIKVKYHKCK